MAITRVQSVSASYQSGGSGTIDLVLPAAPTKGNTLFLVLASTDESDIGTIAQTGVTNWTRINPPIDHSGSPQIRIEIWQAQDVGNSASATVQVTLNDAFESYVGVLVEYEDILRFGTIVDDTASDDGASNIASTGVATTTQDEELWFALVVNVQGNTTQQIPTNGFVELDQLSSGLFAADINLGVYEKIVSATGMAQTELTLSSSQPWVGGVYTFKEDLSTESQITPDVDLAVAEPYDIGSFLNVITAEENLLPLDMNMAVRGFDEFITTKLSPFIVPDLDSGERISLLEVMISGSTIMSSQVGMFADMWIDASELLYPPPTSEDGVLRSALQILLDGQTWPLPSLPTPGTGEVNAGLDLAIDGDSAVAGSFDYTSLLDVYIIGETSVEAGLQVFKAFAFDRHSDLEVHIGAAGPTAQRIKSSMDVAILPLTVLPNVTTTPDGSRYGNCRSLWQAVPKQTKIYSQLGVSVNDFVVFTRTASLGVSIDNAEHAIKAADSTGENFSIAGDETTTFTAATPFDVIGSTGNDGSYTVASSLFFGGDTIITVNEDVVSDVGDGRIDV